MQKTLYTEDASMQKMLRRSKSLRLKQILLQSDALLVKISF